MRLSKKVRGRCREQDIRSLDIDRQFNTDICDPDFLQLFLDLLFNKLPGALKRYRYHTQVVTKGDRLVHDLEVVLGTQPDPVHYLSGGHCDLSRIDTVRTEHGTASAFRTLIEVGKPFVKKIIVQLPGRSQSADQLTCSCKVLPVDTPHQLLPVYRHVPRVPGGDEIVALIGTGTAPYAYIQKHPH